MILSEFKYKESSGWNLDSISLNPLNLIVGLNAVGKSRTIMAIGNVVQFIKGEELVFDDDFSCSLRLTNGYELLYSYEVADGKIASEILQKDNEVLIRRKGASAVVYGKEINPPATKLVVQIHRDTKACPEIEEVIQWAEHTSIFVFSNITTSPHSLSPYAISNEPLLPLMYESIDDERRVVLKGYLKDLGYEIDRIEEFEKPNGVKTIRLYETGIDKPLSPFDLSNGMFRVFCALLYMIYSSTLSVARCLIVDDMGEGLDYSRSKKLSKIVFDYCEEHGIQLIVTSNDNFLMNAVDLKHWILLMREKELVTAVSERTHPDIFLKFKRKGLNNFDLFSSGFVYKYLKSQEA